MGKIVQEVLGDDGAVLCHEQRKAPPQGPSLAESASCILPSFVVVVFFFFPPAASSVLKKYLLSSAQPGSARLS